MSDVWTTTECRPSSFDRNGMLKDNVSVFKRNPATNIARPEYVG